MECFAFLLRAERFGSVGDEVVGVVDGPLEGLEPLINASLLELAGRLVVHLILLESGLVGTALVQAPHLHLIDETLGNEIVLDGLDRHAAAGALLLLPHAVIAEGAAARVHPFGIGHQPFAYKAVEMLGVGLIDKLIEDLGRRRMGGILFLLVFPTRLVTLLAPLVGEFCLLVDIFSRPVDEGSHILNGLLAHPVFMTQFCILTEAFI